MRKVRVKVRRDCSGIWCDIGIYDGRSMIMINPTKSWRTEFAAIRNAKAMARRIGIPFEEGIMQQHGWRRNETNEE